MQSLGRVESMNKRDKKDKESRVCEETDKERERKRVVSEYIC